MAAERKSDMDGENQSGVGENNPTQDVDISNEFHLSEFLSDNEAESTIQFSSSDEQGSRQNPNSLNSAPWCRLLSQQLRDKNVPIFKPEFIIGAEKTCDLVIKHPNSSLNICKISQHIQDDGSLVAMILCTWGKNNVQVNKNAMCVSDSCILNSGDELIFSFGRTHSYIFQQLHGTDVAKNAQIIENNNDHLACLVSSSNLISSKSSSSPQDDVEVSFNNFPYYLSEKTKNILVGKAFLYMKNLQYQTSTKQLKPSEKPKILLSGPAGSEIYQEWLCRALAHHYGSKCLVFDSQRYPIITATKPETEKQIASEWNPPSSVGDSNKPSFRVGDRVVYTGLNVGLPCAVIPSRGPTFGSRGEIVLYFENSYKIGVIFDTAIALGIDLGGACEQGYGFFCNVDEVVLEPIEEDFEKLLSSIFFKAITFESKKCPLFILIKDIKKFLKDSSPPKSTTEKDEKGKEVAISTTESVIDQLSKYVIVIGSQMNTDEKNNVVATSKIVADMFPCQINIDMPEDKEELEGLERHFEADAQYMMAVRNKMLLQNICKQSGLTLEDSETGCITDQVLTVKCAQNIIEWALGYQVMHNPNTCLKSEILLSTESLSYGIATLKVEPTNLLKSIKTKNDFEKNILEESVLHDGAGVKFDDIGALDNVKDALKELVMLPLQRPELFSKGKMVKACKGILLFGPPGTGKTMLAKAVATEAGANFISISIGNISSKYLGDYEKYTKAVFSLASKLAPCVIFIDEADSILGKRTSGETDTWRKMKNEFLSNWDGFLTKGNERVLVLLATNRPFDLDESVIRRLPRRLMVDLPDASNRSKILKVILAKEDLSPDVNFDELANMTPDYSGSDLKNLCDAAAYRPIKEITDKEKNSEIIENEKKEDDKESDLTDRSKVRPLNMDDFRYAKELISASTPSESKNRKALIEWNEKYGESGSENDKLNFPKNIETNNEFEKKILENAVVLSSAIGVKFADIGALDNVKESLKELVTLPLKRPELFSKGLLRKVCRGILLFGPPGTGKTMLAKAVATEAGANLISFSIGSICSKYLGDYERYINAVFSVASKLAPCVIFIDEADSILGRRSSSEQDTWRKMKNEFMLNWDGLATKDDERVLVLLATNRPFDLDDAVIRRLPWRLMVNLPDASSRSKILKVILANENISPDFDFDELSSMTPGFSSSDLKNLCEAAAYGPVKEMIEKEKKEEEDTQLADESSKVRPLNMNDFRYAKERISASTPSESKNTKKLIEWNEKFGESGSGNEKLNFLKNIQTDNEFEKRILEEAVILSSEIGVKFDDIGALDNVKDSLKELVMLPLKRPELFSKGQLRKGCKGILLFGPPGTGKTMIAKAVATEAGANFINISMATISSKWLGESVQYAKAIFTVASKIAPSVIFIDEVDSMLGRRSSTEHETYRMIKNEIMVNWDGLVTKDKERVLVLAATNRPFDLDDAVIRRLPRRLMVNLPDTLNRSKILKVILSTEDVSPDFDFDELADMTPSYSGSDLKNLCVTAAHRPLKEIIESEKKEKEENPVSVSGSNYDIRPLNMDDFRYAKEQVTASSPGESLIMKELLDWNNMYGEGGSRDKKEILTYFL